MRSRHINLRLAVVAPKMYTRNEFMSQKVKFVASNKNQLTTQFQNSLAPALPGSENPTVEFSSVVLHDHLHQYHHHIRYDHIEGTSIVSINIDKDA